jgi:hypothetical protein
VSQNTSTLCAAFVLTLLRCQELGPASIAMQSMTSTEQGPDSTGQQRWGRQEERGADEGYKDEEEDEEQFIIDSTMNNDEDESQDDDIAWEQTPSQQHPR